MGTSRRTAIFLPSGRRWDALRPLGDADGLHRPAAEGVASRREAR